MVVVPGGFSFKALGNLFVELVFVFFVCFVVCVVLFFFVVLVVIVVVVVCVVVVVVVVRVVCVVPVWSVQCNMYTFGQQDDFHAICKWARQACSIDHMLFDG